MKINFQNHKPLFEAFINHNILVWTKNSKELYTNKMYSDKPTDDHDSCDQNKAPFLFIFNHCRKHFLFLFYDFSNKYDISDDAPA